MVTWVMIAEKIALPLWRFKLNSKSEFDLQDKNLIVCWCFFLICFASMAELSFFSDPKFPQNRTFLSRSRGVIGNVVM